MAVTEHLTASFYRLLGDVEAAGRWIDQAIAHARVLDDGGLVLAVCYQEAGYQALVVRDDPHNAVLLLEQAAMISGARQSDRRSMIVSLRLAQAHRLRGAFRDANDYLQAAIRHSRQLADHVGEGYLLLERGELQRDEGDLDEAERTFMQARHILSDAGRPTGEVIAVRLLAQLYTARGHRMRARRMVRQALDDVRIGPLAEGIGEDVETLSSC